jgi:hypothetical protein
VFVVTGLGAAEQPGRKVEETQAIPIIKTVLMLHLLKGNDTQPQCRQVGITENPFQEIGVKFLSVTRDHFRIRLLATIRVTEAQLKRAA